MTFRVFRIIYPGTRLSLTTYTYPDGKLEQYLSRRRSRGDTLESRAIGGCKSRFTRTQPN